MGAASNVKIRPVDMRIIDRVFGMEGGYVLDFSNRTFAEFFREEFNVDIHDDHWAVQGGSKANRLRSYLRRADPRTALDALNALWEYREASSVTADYPELDDSVRAAYFRIIERLGGKSPATPRLRTRLPGPAVLSSAKAASQKTDYMPLGAARASCAWMDSICTMSWPAGLTWPKSSH